MRHHSIPPAVDNLLIDDKYTQPLIHMTKIKMSPVLYRFGVVKLINSLKITYTTDSFCKGRFDTRHRFAMEITTFTNKKTISSGFKCDVFRVCFF